MLVSLNWIKDFVDINEVDSKELTNKFTMAVAEIDNDFKLGVNLKNIVVCKILEINKHPMADKLNLVKVDIGNSNVVEVVCGASNVKVGMLVPYAPIGTTLPNGITLESRSIRGVVSNGMLCSAEELGMAESSDGLLEVVGDVGKSIDSESVEDLVIDIDNKSLTHRPDLWGIYGLAREFAAIYESPLKNPFDNNWENNLVNEFTNDSPVKIQKNGESALLGYMGLAVSNVKVGVSPKWMQNRLIACGIRPINNMVDIGNYVMLELGMPVHIFDRKEIEGDIVLRELTADESFITLDGKEHKLIKGDTVVSDLVKPLVIAGIMGGKNSGVTDTTTEIFIEAANWDSTKVRKTSMRLGLRSDSSVRYEKSLDSSLLYRTLLRVYDLVRQLSPGASVVGKVESVGNFNPSVLTIKTSVDRINNRLGITVTKEKIISILESLQFLVEAKDNILNVTVPSFRATKDIELEVDIIEEVGRMIGYDNIKEEAPLFPCYPVSLSPLQLAIRKIENFLSLNAKAMEVKLMPLVSYALLEKSMLPVDGNIKLLNPLSNDQELLRDNLLAGVLESVSHNQKYFESFRFFEIGKVYSKKNDVLSEKYMLALAFSNGLNSFNELVSVVESLMDYLGVKYKLQKNSKTWAGFHPNESLTLLAMGKNYGELFTLNPYLGRILKIKDYLHIFTLDLTPFVNAPKDKYKFKELDRYPLVKFDFTVTASKNYEVRKLVDLINGFKIKELKSTKIKDIFLRDNDKTVTIRTVLGSEEKTLDGETLTSKQNEIIKKVEASGILLKR